MSHLPRLHAARLFAVVLLCACGGSTLPDAITTPPAPPAPPAPRPTLGENYRPSGHAAAGDVAVHLFEWPWNDIASECENVLGPAGVTAVQVSPPQEHSITPSHDWSERYQPVSYSIARSRSGTGAEFTSMVSRCRAAGVGIYVDAVINHMTNSPSPGTGSNGTQYSKYSYPGLYAPGDFHPACTVTNYADAANVQDCELLGLPDLNTALPSVRQKIADYLLSLARLGVAGFRIDAAKHIQQLDLDAIFTLVNTALVAEGKPVSYYYLEVSGSSSEAIQPHHYFGEAYASGGSSDITEFTFVGVGNKFLNANGEHISQLNPNGTPGNQFSPSAWGLMPSDKAIVFIQNHDTQHNGGLSYRQPAQFRLANVWMLAQPYGYPSILSAYAFDLSNTPMGPRSDAQGWTLPVSCAASLEVAKTGDWTCEHRDPYVLHMVAFRKFVAGTDVNHWWDNGGNAIAFSRGDRGFVAINDETTAVSANVTTSLAPGTYCDLISGGRSGTGCVGSSIVVGAGGAVALSIGARNAVAIDGGSKL